MNTYRTALLAAALSGGCTAWAQDAGAAAFASLDVIDREVAGFTGVPVGQPGGATLPVDRRLRLASCRSPLALAWRSERHDSVVVECPDAGSWHLFVPVRMNTPVSSTPAVLRGESLSLVVSGEGFSVSQPGEAMESGAVGAWIRVRTVKDGTTKGEPMRARVVRPGLAMVPVD